MLTSVGKAYERFLDQRRAENKIVKELGPSRALTQCPGPNHKNEDRNPSLSVAQGQGRVLLWCFRHCTYDQIAAAIGWTPQDLFDDPKGVVYRYDEGREVRRGPGKKFVQSGHTNGQVTQLYHLAKIKSAPSNEIIYLVEGEQDVETIETLGLIATTAPMGAQAFHRVDATPLYERKIIAIVDKDEGGQEWASQVRAKLDGMPELLEFKQAKIGKDASDHITAVGSLSDLEDFEFERSPLLARLRTGDWLDQQIFPDLRWVVPGVIPEGFTLLVGAPKIGKSYMALGIALASAMGGRAFGRIDVEHRPVLMLALEDSDRRMQKRIRELIPDTQMPKQFTYLTTIDQGAVIVTILAWLETLRAAVHPLIILDTVGKVIPPTMPGETTYMRDYRMAGWLQGICAKRPGTALIGLHHDRKAQAEDFVETVSGTHGLAGAADTIMVINRKRNEKEGVLRIAGRDVEENEYGIKIGDYGWQLIGDDLIMAAQAAHTIGKTINLGDQMAEIVALITRENRPMGPPEVADITGISPQIVRKYLTRLLDKGVIAKQGRGLYTPVASGTSVSNWDTNSTRDKGTNRDTDQGSVSPLHEGRCEECRWHIETQGHRSDCSRFHGGPK